ncbi:MAG: hypothetical protein ABSC63_08810 [Candidatus Binataceae bacterium]|jgi:hypothetical protein
MIWRRRCLVLVPVLSFLAAALIMSCGGGSSSSTIVATPSTILGINVCLGAPPTGTPKPTPTNGHTPTPTPTPICTPVVSSATVGTTVGMNTVQFNAQGIFGFANSPKTEKFHDVTNSVSTVWNPIAPTVTFPGEIVSDLQTPGLFIGKLTGCTYFTVSDAGFSQSIVVGVNVDPTTCASPPAAIRKPPASIQPSP